MNDHAVLTPLKAGRGCLLSQKQYAVCIDGAVTVCRIGEADDVGDLLSNVPARSKFTVPPLVETRAQSSGRRMRTEEQKVLAVRTGDITKVKDARPIAVHAEARPEFDRDGGREPLTRPPGKST